MKIFIKYIYITIGLIAFALGVIGVVIPVLPTTPFLLLASYCFAKGSKKFDLWFKSTKIYKKNLKGFIEDKSMTLKEKLTIVSFAYTMLLITLIATDKMVVKFIITGCMLFIFYYFTFVIRTISKEEKDRKNKIKQAS